MILEGRVFRPPSEARSLIVQATIGCSHNKCSFCGMYKDKDFRIRRAEEVLSDLARDRKDYTHVERIFIADGDALTVRTEQLVKILSYIRENYPECKRVGIYATPFSISLKSDEELRRLRDAGLHIVYLGLESGSDTVLARVNKGSTSKEIGKEALRVKEAGLVLSVTIINGLGGAELMEEHALKTAQALSRIKPHYIAALVLMADEFAPLLADIKCGRFMIPGLLDLAKENLIMLENIDAEGSVFRSNHASNYVILKGTLNRDRDAMIDKLRQALSGDLELRPESFRSF